MSGQKKWSDSEMLDVLRRRDEGQTCSSIARDYGVSPNAITGLTARIRADFEASNQARSIKLPIMGETK